MLTEIFTATQALIMDGITDPDRLYERLKEQFPHLEKKTFMNEVWQALKDHVIQEEVDIASYMFTNFEGTLWVKEAFMQAEYHLSEYKMPFFMMVSMIISMVMFGCVCLANATTVGAESMSEWMMGLPKHFWLCNGLILMSFFMLSMVNLTFLYAASKDFQRRNYVNTLLNEMLEVDANRRTPVGIRMLSINFCHPVSLLTWLEMRRMSLDIGKRFFLRI